MLKQQPSSAADADVREEAVALGGDEVLEAAMAQAQQERGELAADSRQSPGSDGNKREDDGVHSRRGG